MSVHVETLTGSRKTQVLPELSKLRCRVFREWPYLYEGDPAAEARYLEAFAQSDESVIVVACEDNTIVGMATAAPLSSHTPEFVPLFRKHGFDSERVFYFGESVLLASHRGQGIGHAFFDHREQAARTSRSSGWFQVAAFCAVVREANDCRRPAEARSLEPFWKKRGYIPVPGMIGNYDWSELGASEETPHPMQFWQARLSNEPTSIVS